MRFPQGRGLEKNHTAISLRGTLPMNSTMRLLREHLNFSIQEVADATGLSFRTILRAEQGASLNPESRRRLCQFYGKTSEELGLVPRSRNGTYHQQLQEQTKKHIN
jgi:transcriptional regulator with XRE-family HTH domain